MLLCGSPDFHSIKKYRHDKRFKQLVKLFFGVSICFTHPHNTKATTCFQYACLLSICLSQSQGFSSKVIPKSLSQSLLLISGKTGDSAFLVLPWIVISYVFDRFNDILLLAAQSLRNLGNYRAFIASMKRLWTSDPWPSPVVHGTWITSMVHPFSSRDVFFFF